MVTRLSQIPNAAEPVASSKQPALARVNSRPPRASGYAVSIDAARHRHDDGECDVRVREAKGRDLAGGHDAIRHAPNSGDHPSTGRYAHQFRYWHRPGSTAPDHMRIEMVSVVRTQFL